MLSRRSGLIRRLAAAATVPVALTAVVVAPAAPAHAQASCTPVMGAAVCENEQETPGTGDGNDGGPSAGGSGDRICRYDDQTVPCYHEQHGWYEGEGCYLRLAQPQPEIPPPPGAHPGGAWYMRTCPYGGPDGSDRNRTAVWRNPGEVGPNPEELARRALARIGLGGPEIGIAPDPSGAGLVGLPVYLWTERYGPGESYEATESEAGLVVSIRATAVETEWDMGDGTIRYCGVGDGVPYHPSYGSTPSRCGHTYQRPSHDKPGGHYRIVATTRWTVEYWSNISDRDQFPFQTWSETTATIHELQVVTS